MEFRQIFKVLTGNDPLQWQCRLYAQWRENKINPVIDLPTGMGKTAVIAIWLIARADAQKNSVRLPTRLVYVVDRRTVVDQATDVAQKIRKSAADAGLEIPTISTLRGQFADNREWTCDPSKPAIIIGTVDMIGSRLLFSGYRSSYKQRPLDAGLLGQDSLLILDEAHLSQPFAKLLRDIGSDGPFQKSGQPMRVVHMSATTVTDHQDAFRLEESDLKGDRESNVIAKRYQAEKRLRISEDIEEVKPEIVKEASQLATDGSRVVVFVRSPEDAQKIADAIKKTMGKKKTPAKCVEILTGTMRGLERDELMEKQVMKRFLEPQNQPDNGPAILVSTSAGEVGFDLNADHLVCDAAPLDSIIQRLGRVNRRGETCATVHLFAKKQKESEKSGEDASPPHSYETATIKTIEILNKQLPRLTDGILDASPKAFANLEKPVDALAPKPAIAQVTDILLDAWSMTSIAEAMPGRPPVADWLRGISKDMPQTTIAWRAELDEDGFGDLDIDDIEEWFDAHRVLPHETLTVPPDEAAKQLAERWANLADKVREDIKNRPCVLDQGGLRTIAVNTLLERLGKKPNPDTRDILNADLILPASFGGIERGVGVLDTSFPIPASDPDTAGPAKATDPADVADIERPGTDRRYRLIRTGPTEQPLSGEKPPDAETFSEFILDLPPDGDTARQLISAAPKRSRREYGSEKQSLAEHVASVEKHAERIALDLTLEPPIADALRLAAKYHDHGKNRELWQRLVDGQTTPAGKPWAPETLGKSGGKMGLNSNGYRHEFGSLREFVDAHAGKMDTEIFDLAAHLIATHHGRARPHFPKGGFDPDARARSPEIATEAMRRFVRLQRKYGYWRLAWLENLLRCADALASAENKGSKND